MKFKNILLEDYTSIMNKELRPYLKEIADDLSKNLYISIKNSEFTEISCYNKPVAFSSITKIIKDQLKNLNTYFEYALAIIKHSSGGITIGSFTAGGRGVSSIDIYKSYGDMSGKVTYAFTTEISSSDFSNMRKLSAQRKEANAPYTDPHDISKQIKRKLAVYDNPAIKAIMNKASQLGFRTKSSIIKVSDQDGRPYLRLSNIRWKSEEWIKGIPHIDVEIRYSIEYDYKKLSNLSYNDKLETSVCYNASTASIGVDDNSNLQANIEMLKEIVKKIEQAKELSDFINTFTYEDLRVEDTD